MSPARSEGEATARALNDLARHELIHRIYADILTDMTVCEIEGWDKLELIHLLQELINGFLDKEKRETGAGVRSDAGGVEIHQECDDGAGRLSMDL